MNNIRLEVIVGAIIGSLLAVILLTYVVWRPVLEIKYDGFKEQHIIRTVPSVDSCTIDGLVYESTRESGLYVCANGNWRKLRDK